MTQAHGSTEIPQGWEARRALWREIPWLRRRHHLYHRDGPGFRSVREAAVLLGFANYVWSPLRWAEWALASLAGVVFAWFIGKDGLSLDDVWIFIVVPVAIGLELYRTKRLAARARAYLDSHDALPPGMVADSSR